TGSDEEAGGVEPCDDGFATTTATGEARGGAVDVGASVGVGVARAVSAKSARTVSPVSSVRPTDASPFGFWSLGGTTLIVYLPGSSSVNWYLPSGPVLRESVFDPNVNWTSTPASGFALDEPASLTMVPTIEPRP